MIKPTNLSNLQIASISAHLRVGFVTVPSAIAASTVAGPRGDIGELRKRAPLPNFPADEMGSRAGDIAFLAAAYCAIRCLHVCLPRMTGLRGQTLSHVWVGSG
jgi:hypothetical protein